MPLILESQKTKDFIDVCAQELDHIFKDNQTYFIHVVDQSYYEYKMNILLFLSKNTNCVIHVLVTKAELISPIEISNTITLTKKQIEKVPSEPKYQKANKSEDFINKSLFSIINLKKVAFYANVKESDMMEFVIDNQAFNKYQIINVLISLHFSIAEIEGILPKFGYGFIETLRKDRLIKSYLQNEIYDVFIINEAIFFEKTI